MCPVVFCLVDNELDERCYIHSCLAFCWHIQSLFHGLCLIQLKFCYLFLFASVSVAWLLGCLVSEAESLLEGI